MSKDGSYDSLPPVPVPKQQPENRLQISYNSLHSNSSLSENEMKLNQPPSPPSNPTGSHIKQSHLPSPPSYTNLHDAGQEQKLQVPVSAKKNHRGCMLF